MRVLITGGAGFIGSHVATALSTAGHDVVRLDCLHPASHGEDALPDNGLVVADVRDRGAVESALRGIDAVVHHAAIVGMGVGLRDLPDYVSCNDLGTAVLLAAMADAGIRRLVLASSMVVYGEGAYTCASHGAVVPPSRASADLSAGRFEPLCPRCGLELTPASVTEEAMLQPRNVYGATKVAQEHLAGAWARESGGVGIALRYHNVYGTGMPRNTPYAGVTAIFRSSLDRGEPPRVFEDGAQRRDFVHVTDVAAANVAALAATGSGEGLRPYNISSGHPRSVGEVAAALAAAYGGPAPVITGEFRAGDVRHVTASPERARAELGFVARADFAGRMAELASQHPGPRRATGSGA